MEEIKALLTSAANRLADTSEEVRYAAVKDLSRSNVIGAVPLLMQAVGDSSYRVREEALHGICSFPSETMFPRLEAFLRNHENANNRNAAIEAFPRYGEQATPYLLQLLKDYDEEVRIFSAVMLGRVNDPLAVSGLIEALNDPEENVRHAAAESLGELGDARAVKPLIDCLRKDFWVQYAAVVALGQIGDPQATPALISLLEDEMLQQAVVEALGKIGDISTIPVLADMLSKNESQLRNDIIAALVNIQSRVEKHIVSDGSVLPSIKKSLEKDELIDHLIESLRDDELETRKNAIIALGWLKEKRAAKELVKMLNEYEIEEYVVGSLISIGEAALPEFISGLKNPDPKIRISLIRCIGWTGDAKCIEECIPYLVDEDREVRLQAISALSGALDSEKIEDALIGMISDSDPEVQTAAVEALGKSLSSSLAGKLLSNLSADDKSQRFATIQLLGKLKAPSAIEPLQDLLDDESDDIRAEIYRALSAIRPDKMSIEVVLRGLADESPVVRKASADCLAAFPKESIESNLIILLDDPDPEVRLSSLETLGKIGTSSCLEHLKKLYADGDKRFKLAVIGVMGNIRHKKGTQFLVDLLKEGDSDIKRAALQSLGELRDQKSIFNIIVALDDADWSVRGAAIQALEKIGDRRCINFLLEKLKDPENIIKKSAINALGKLGAKQAVNAILPLMYNENLQLEVIGTVEKLGVSDYAFYYDFFARSNTNLKCHLVDILGRLKNSDTLDFLARVLDDEFFTVRASAAKALGELGDKKAIPYLLKAQKADPSEEVQKEATLALKKLDALK